MTHILKEIVFLAADKNMESAIKGILTRTEPLGIRKISYDIFTHVNHDPGCLNESHEFLRPFRGLYNHALVVFDMSGCGREEKGRDELEQEVRQRLYDTGWGARAQAIVIEPELESWVWSTSPEVAHTIGWKEKAAELRLWLLEKGFWQEGACKPAQPKEAMEAAMREVKMPRSSSVYKKLAEKVSFSRCTDPSFLRLKELLREWFGQP